MGVPFGKLSKYPFLHLLLVGSPVLPRGEHTPNMEMPLKSLLQAVAALGTVSSLCFYVVSSWAVLRFLNERRRKLQARTIDGEFLPPVSILKPLKGIDPAIWDSFCSHCEQDYPEYELIFGVSDAGDPAIEVVRRLQQEYPERRIELLVCERKLGANTKVSTLAQMLPAARHGLLLINDSDIRVEADYLRRAVAPLADDCVGLVTCLYRGQAGPTLGSRLEALGISTDFVPGVLTAKLLEGGLRFGFGSTLAVRKKDLDAIGGFEVLLDYLADDYELGRRMHSLGKRVELSEIVVDTFLPDYSLGAFFDHQIRWSRTIRDARRWGYVGVVFTFGLPWALLTLALTRGVIWAWVLGAATLIIRVLLAMASAMLVLRDSQIWRDLILLPVRDLLAPVLWALSFAGNSISWRGDVFSLKQGRLARVSR